MPGVRVLAWVILGRRLRIDGMERVPATGAVLVIGNHVGTVEPALTGVFIPRRDVYYMAKSELFRNPLLGWLFRQNHAFPVVRNTADRAALRVGSGGARRRARPARVPEGTRSWDGHNIGEIQAGAGFIARHSGALVVPVASWGSERVIPRGSWIRRAGGRGAAHRRAVSPSLAWAGWPTALQQGSGRDHDGACDRIAPRGATARGSDDAHPRGEFARRVIGVSHPDHLVAFDLETTGLSPRSDRILEIGAVRYDRALHPIDELQVVVDPQMPIPLAIQRLVGLTDDDVHGSAITRRGGARGSDASAATPRSSRTAARSTCSSCARCSPRSSDRA